MPDWLRVLAVIGAMIAALACATIETIQNRADQNLCVSYHSAPLDREAIQTEITRRGLFNPVDRENAEFRCVEVGMSRCGVFAAWGFFQAYQVRESRDGDWKASLPDFKADYVQEKWGFPRRPGRDFRNSWVFFENGLVVALDKRP